MLSPEAQRANSAQHPDLIGNIGFRGKGKNLSIQRKTYQFNSNDKKHVMLKLEIELVRAFSKLLKVLPFQTLALTRRANV